MPTSHSKLLSILISELSITGKCLALPNCAKPAQSSASPISLPMCWWYVLAFSDTPRWLGMAFYLLFGYLVYWYHHMSHSSHYIVQGYHSTQDQFEREERKIIALILCFCVSRSSKVTDMNWFFNKYSFFPLHLRYQPYKSPMALKHLELSYNCNLYPYSSTTVWNGFFFSSLKKN